VLALDIYVHDREDFVMEYLEIVGVAGVGPYPMLYLCRLNLRKATIETKYKQGWALFGRKATNLEGQNVQEAVGRLANTLLKFEPLATVRSGALAKLDAVIHNRRVGGDNRLSIPCD
jgi:hypothetical protein